MNFRTVFFAAVGLMVFVIWQHKDRHTRVSRVGESMPAIEFASEPQQTSTDAESFEFSGFQVQPLAQFDLNARILSRQNYSYGIEAKISPIDLALGWNRMADPDVYERLNISQSNRWYRYSWRIEPPLPQADIVASSANMHMIPANAEVLSVLQHAETGKTIRLSGYLVEVRNDQGWRWRSSTSRTDTGSGACEVIFVRAAEVY